MFNNRPVADSKGEVSSADREQFQSSCNMICINLMFITCLVDAAMPEESGQLVASIYNRVHVQCTFYTVVLDTWEINLLCIHVLFVLCHFQIIISFQAHNFLGELSSI